MNDKVLKRRLVRSEEPDPQRITQKIKLNPENSIPEQEDRLFF